MSSVCVPDSFFYCRSDDADEVTSVPNVLIEESRERRSAFIRRG